MAGDRRALTRTARELRILHVEDREWLGAIGARLFAGAPEPPDRYLKREPDGQNQNVSGLASGAASGRTPAG
jgi:hypothetical protein